MQQRQGGRSPYDRASSQSQTETAPIFTTPPAVVGDATAQQQLLKLGDPSSQQLGAAEEASPISSRPPAVPHFEAAGGDDDAFGIGSDEAEGDRGGGVSGAGNRWPRQETLALLKIRSDMDAAFRDATLKGPLWDDVSRKLAELGYHRSPKKCKEKFENVHKYYKRTKEGRAGRQDGKSYRFFTQLEALHGTTSNTTTINVSATIPPSSTTGSVQVVSPVPVSIGIGVANIIPLSSSVGIPQTNAGPPPGIGVFAPAPTHVFVPASTTALPFAPNSTLGGVCFSSDSSSSSSSSSGSDQEVEEDDDVMELEEEGTTPNTTTRKRKRASSSKHHLSSRDKMMEFFEGLMKQVMQNQEAMQQRFLEAIEKREQDRMIREEAWKRQEMARLAREHELVSQDRAISASRDAAIIAFLQKITGRTIQLPQAAVTTVPAAAAPPPAVHHVYQPPPPPSQPPPSSQQPQQPQLNYVPPQPQKHPTNRQQHLLSHDQQQHPQSAQLLTASYRNQPAAAAITTLSEIVVAIPEQEVALAQQETSSTTVGDGSFEATSSRWPKPEVLALIKLRSGLESRYQEAGPKGPLWEEISAGMHRMGYKRNAKRCKEKWENINKYFKKVKESNKKRSEDAKTCPYFHQLDALYKKKILGTTTTLGVNQIRADQLQQEVQDASMIMVPKVQEPSHISSSVVPSPQTATATASDLKDGSTTDFQKSNGGLTENLFGEGSDGPSGGAKQPADTVEEEEPQNHQRQLTMNEYGDIEEPESDNVDQEDDEYDDLDDDDEDDEEETKMAYRIQFQRQNTGSNGGETTDAPSFLAMVQ